ncbi:MULTISPECIES: Crp/Fnr family transcriptional regulator [unclassified Bradyrhizobium]|uniref:Crp/Fnr family transcriptional regulator n=1 Tax=unclassified Bradyrhizobium TaxID=2631580 RepID=UPI0028E6688C|nr:MULTISPECIES: Crp/Fnr family transcriptional regulator [unclassified Bradyrhizobium]
MHHMVKLIRRLRSATELSEHDIAAIKALPVELKAVEPETQIAWEGDRPQACCMIVTGFAYRAKVTETGKRQILSFHIPGDIPDLQSLLLKTMDHDIVTISAATLAFIDHADLSRLIDAHPAVARALWRETMIDAAVFRQWILNLGVRSASARMAHLLAELRQRLAEVGLVDDNAYRFPITQSELAEALGLSTVHVNRVLQEFRSQRVLDIRKNLVKLIDVDKVVAAGEFDPAYLHQIDDSRPGQSHDRDG